VNTYDVCLWRYLGSRGQVGKVVLSLRYSQPGQGSAEMIPCAAILEFAGTESAPNRQTD
jgi:hypothetical protein